MDWWNKRDQSAEEVATIKAVSFGRQIACHGETAAKERRPLKLADQPEAGNQHYECEIEREEPRRPGDQLDFAEFTFFGCHKKAFSFVACGMPVPMPFSWTWSRQQAALLAFPSLPTLLTRQSSLPILWQPWRSNPLLSWH